MGWPILRDNADIITGGGLLQDVGGGDHNLYQLSSPCKLGSCDVFWSHSWSDSGQLKMRILLNWATSFQEQVGRTPSLWLDKVCVDQTNISADLRCLPVFLAGCNSLLVTSGPTYASRLWCALELFVYFSMLTEDPSRKPPTVLLLASDSETHSRVQVSWLAFDVEKCNCFHDEDKARIVGVIEQFPGGKFGFNAYIRGLARDVLSAAVGSNGCTSHSILVGHELHEEGCEQMPADLEAALPDFEPVEDDRCIEYADFEQNL